LGIQRTLPICAWVYQPKQANTPIFDEIIMTVSIANHIENTLTDIIVRESMDFKLDSTIPKYWFDNDPVKTRMIETVCATFPEGEKYFIQSVRHFREKIQSPRLKEEVRQFIRQESQHGIIHTQFNDLLRLQGMPVNKLEDALKKKLSLNQRKLSPEMNLAVTAACEHLTALFVECFFKNHETMAGVQDTRILSMLAWHSIEEMEHKSVAYDVMQYVARVSYLKRVTAMILLTTDMSRELIVNTNSFLKADGFSFPQRVKHIARGLHWGFGRKGILAPMAKSYLKYFQPDFHPSHEPDIEQYATWLDVYALTYDPIQAGEAFHRAAKK
jgi:predicted metal-dependent hydrolase